MVKKQKIIWAIVLVPDILISLYIVLLKTIEATFNIDRFGILSIAVFNILFHLAVLIVVQKKEVSISKNFYMILLAIFIKNIVFFLFDTYFLL